jgi:hypothetical protein
MERERSPGPPPVDRSSLAAALQKKMASKAPEVSKPDLEAKSSSSSSDSDKKPILPPKLPIKPDNTGRRSPKALSPKVPRERIHSDGGNNLAEILKAKFESRSSTANENGNEDNSSFNTYPKKSGIQVSQLPVSHSKSNPDCSNKTDLKPAKPVLPHKFEKPVTQLKPCDKNEFAPKRLSMQEDRSELANVLQARLRRQSNIEVATSQHYSAVEKPKKSFPSKPMIPEKPPCGDRKPILPPKTDGRKVEGKENSVTNVTNSKFEKIVRPGWKKESCKPKSKPPVLLKPKKPVLPRDDTKNSIRPENDSESPTKPGFAKELASKLSSNIKKQDTNTDPKPPIPKKSPLVQNMCSAKIDHNVHDVTSVKSSVTVQSYRSIAKYQAEGDGEVSFEEGVELEVLDNSKSDGWWLVKVGTNQGWAPVTYIEPCGSGPRSPSPVCDSGFTSPEEGSNSVSSVKYRTCAEFIPESETELGFKEGCVVEVLDASEDDWWYARIDGKEGWVPAEYLEEV